MSVAHLLFNPQIVAGRRLRGALDQFESGFMALQEEVATMLQMLNSGVADDYLKQQYGFPDVSTAQAAYNELASDVGKLQSNSSQDNVNAAILQMLAKFR